MINHPHKICIAPMMQYTDMHDRYLLRLITKNAVLYTEMITSASLFYGKSHHQLDFNTEEHPVAAQLGGSNFQELKFAAKLCESKGYDEINLNVGCPSDRVQKGKIGACLMLEPELVRDCISEISSVTTIPITIKCRLGVDDFDSFDFIQNFISIVSESGIKTFIIHARNAILSGLSPRQNRSIPPLKYEYVYKIKELFPNHKIIINGGITELIQCKEHLLKCDGVMIGRASYDNPMLLQEIEKNILGNQKNHLNRAEILNEYIKYTKKKIENGYDISRIFRHLSGLGWGHSNAKKFRKLILEVCQSKDINKYENKLIDLLV